MTRASSQIGQIVARQICNICIEIGLTIYIKDHQAASFLHHTSSVKNYFTPLESVVYLISSTQPVEEIIL